MQITVTHYVSGTGAPYYLEPKECLSVQDALTDMIDRLKAGAYLTDYGLVTRFGPCKTPTGDDCTIYGDLPPKLVEFIVCATRWNRDGKDGVLGSPEHDQFIRLALLKATGHGDLAGDLLGFALNMPEEQFCAAMAMAIENDETVTELFC